jgi:hypothetical protein
MLHTKTPDADGWYWISTEERQIDETESEVGHWMAYLDVETGDLVKRAKLFVTEPESASSRMFFEASPGVFRDEDVTDLAIKPKYWIGPLSCPFGPFGDSIIEPELEHHLLAENKKRNIVIKYVNYQHSTDHGETWTRTKFVKPDEHLEE